MGLLLDFEMGDTAAVMAVPRTVAEKVPVCTCVRACMKAQKPRPASAVRDDVFSVPWEGCPGEDKKGHTREHFHKPP